jgi:glutamate-ammonia-ligase adenylyltransferase
MERCCTYLSEHTDEGYVYRVDLRLRPYGSSGKLVQSTPALVEYYHHKASLWEIQALLKIRPVAGNLELGESFMHAIAPLFSQAFDVKELIHSIETLRSQKIKLAGKGMVTGIDIKSGAGGIRDIEFLTQGLQLLNCYSHADLCERHTVRALSRLRERGILAPAVADTLIADYTFLRRIEHFLQVYEDQQTHSLPHDCQELSALSNRIMGVDSKPEEFLENVEACMLRIRDVYQKNFLSLA